MIAERVGRTVSELEATMPSHELTEWFALLGLEADEAKRAQQAAKSHR